MFSQGQADPQDPPRSPPFLVGILNSLQKLKIWLRNFAREVDYQEMVSRYNILVEFIKGRSEFSISSKASLCLCTSEGKGLDSLFAE